jgi:hypothetical protein
MAFGGGHAEMGPIHWLCHRHWGGAACLGRAGIGPIHPLSSMSLSDAELSVIGLRVRSQMES